MNVTAKLIKEIEIFHNNHPCLPDEETKLYIYFHTSRFIQTFKLLKNILSSESRLKPKILDLGPNPYLSTLILSQIDADYVGLSGGFYINILQEKKDYAIKTKLNDKQFTIPIKDGYNMEKEKFPFQNESFDIVLFLEIIEHFILDPVFCMKEIARVLKPNGKLVLTTDNANSFIKFLKFISGKSIYWPYSDETFGDRHNREFLAKELTDLLNGIGFKDINVNLKNLMPYSFKASPAKYIGYVVSNIITSLPYFNKFKRQLVCVATKDKVQDYYPGWLFMHKKGWVDTIR